ncbi:MAG: dTDP-4-dehydrorhamnose 3,5-epimerase [Ignavibacteriales bacterium]|nr:dTDP-4-dehydrorhamnose 3,5-epimerase [Ignavibacteriales bacterium]
MRIQTTPLDGLLIITPDVFADDRGYFFESFSRQKYSDVFASREFVQDNISKSQKGTVRGLHYQVAKNAQGKLCQVLTGRVLDVALDIRFGSPTFGKYFAVELSEENHMQFWLPPGFAHGFSVLSDVAIFHYKCTALYSRADERSIRYDDPSLKIDWNVDDPIVSTKDAHAPMFAEIDQDFVF